MSWGDSQRAVFFDPEGCLTACIFEIDLEAEHQGQMKLIDVVLTA